MLQKATLQRGRCFIVIARLRNLYLLRPAFTEFFKFIHEQRSLAQMLRILSLLVSLHQFIKRIFHVLHNVITTLYLSFLKML